MTKEEIALDLTKLFYENHNGEFKKNYFETYKLYLELIVQYKSPSTLGKIEELIDEYDRLPSYCEFERFTLIDNIRKLVKGGSNE